MRKSAYIAQIDTIELVTIPGYGIIKKVSFWECNKKGQQVARYSLAVDIGTPVNVGDVINLSDLRKYAIK